SQSDAATLTDESGVYVRLSGNDDRLNQKAVHSYEPGRRYRARARVERIGNGAMPSVEVGLRVLRSDYTFGTVAWTSPQLITNDPEWYAFEINTPSTQEPDFAHVRFCIRNNSGPDFAHAKVYAFSVEDIT